MLRPYGLVGVALLMEAASVRPAVVEPPPDVARAFTEARVRAEAGDVVAEYSLGSVLYSGTSSTDEGVRWIRRAADRGHVPAEFAVGQFYEFGFGVARDDRQALVWYRRAADA